MVQVFLEAWARHKCKGTPTTSAGMWFVEEFLPVYKMAFAALAMHKLPGASDDAQVVHLS